VQLGTNIAQSQSVKIAANHLAGLLSTTNTHLLHGTIVQLSACLSNDLVLPAKTPPLDFLKRAHLDQDLMWPYEPLFLQLPVLTWVFEIDLCESSVSQL
jgi:hypothetical protein